MPTSRKYLLDTETRNLSFIQTAVDLKRLGIKNNMFFLALYDPSLRNVDPYDPRLTTDEMIRVINECVINPWYFLREVARIPDQGNPKGIPYQLNRANLAGTWCFLHGIDNYEVIPRQIGKTQSTIAILDWSFLYGTTDSEFMFINMIADKAWENLARLKDQRDLLPAYLQMKISIDENGKIDTGTDNVKTLSNANNGNKIVTKGQAVSIETAEKIGRGSTQPIQYYDEFEFINYVKTIMEASGPAFSTASKNAKRNKAMYGRIFTSTPGDLDSRSGQDALMVVEQTCNWTEKFYDMAVDDVYDYIEKNSKNGIVYIEYQYQQLGKDEEWFNEVCRLLNNNPLKIKREIFLMRLRGSSLSPYSPEDLQVIEEHKGKILKEIFLMKIFKIDIYTELDKSLPYIVGVDVANGYGEDSSAITILDPYTVKVVAEFKSPNIGVKNLIQFIYILVKQHIPRSILAIERNANGEAVLDHLRSTDIAGNIYFDNSKDFVADDIDDKLDSMGFIQREAKRRKLYGIYTNGKSRERMFALLDGHVQEHKDKFIGNNLINEIMQLVRTPQGKIEAGKGFHDDCVMSYLMCLYVYYYGNNLERFGFVRGKLPDESEMNKGMLYEDIESYLSETDKQFFEGVPFETSKDIIDSLDFRQMIQDRKGLISSSELENAARKAMMGNDEDSDDKRKNQEPRGTINMDPYSLKIYKEMQQAQRESEAFNKHINFTNGYENMSVDEESESWDFIDELNE